MKTKIYKSHSEFLARENKLENGVSEDFAKYHPGFEKENANNDGCFNCSDCSGCYACSDCSGCSGCYACYGCSGCSGCYDCSRCSDCYGCSRCSDCSGCSGCSRCYGCSGCKNKTNSKEPIEIPIIPNLHQAVLSAVKHPGALDMSDWHRCETTHCRAGWVVTLAGDKGKKLEKATSTLFAAMQICKASSKIKVSPVRFFEANEQAMADIERCAKEESETAK